MRTSDFAPCFNRQGLAKAAQDGDGRSGRPALALAALLLAAAWLAACDGGPRVETARGYVIGVESKSLLELDVLRVRTESGETLELSARGRTFPGFPPSHLREHMTQGLPVTVSYHREGDALALDEVRD